MTSLRTVLAALALTLFALAPSTQAQPGEITIDATTAAHPFPHFWEVMFGSGRAILALRDNYRRDIQEVHDQVGMRYVRFHAIPTTKSASTTRRNREHRSTTSPTLIRSTTVSLSEEYGPSSR